MCWAQPVASITWAMVAPSARRRRVRTACCFVPVRCGRGEGSRGGRVAPPRLKAALSASIEVGSAGRSRPASQATSRAVAASRSEVRGRGAAGGADRSWASAAALTAGCPSLPSCAPATASPAGSATPGAPAAASPASVMRSTTPSSPDSSSSSPALSMLWKAAFRATAGRLGGASANWSGCRTTEVRICVWVGESGFVMVGVPGRTR